MNNINKSIEGYELVKNVVSAEGCERTGYDYLFAVRRKGACGFGEEGLDSIMAVTPNTHENYERLTKEFPFEDYIIWSGTILPNYRYNKVLYRWEKCDTDRIELYWS